MEIRKKYKKGKNLFNSETYFSCFIYTFLPSFFLLSFGFFYWEWGMGNANEMRWVDGVGKETKNASVVLVLSFVYMYLYLSYKKEGTLDTHQREYKE